MKYVFGAIGIIILSILVVLLAISLSSLIFWGLGNLIIWVFKINYTWTILHGLVCAVVFALLKEIFDGK